MNKFDFEVASVCETEAIIIEGGPGTGKTHLLLKRLEFLSNNMRSQLKDKALQNSPFNDVLYLCFNVELAKRVRSFVNQNSLRVDVWSYHAFCEFLVKQQGISVDSLMNKTEDEREYYDKILPEAALEYFNKLEVGKLSWKAVLIDDVGDFRTELPWSIFTKSLRRGGQQWLAWDSGQVKDSSDSKALAKVKALLPNFPVWKLERNLRFSSTIFSEVSKYKPWTKLIFGGGDRVLGEINKCVFDGSNLEETLDSVLVDLYSKGYASSDIVILGSKYLSFTSFKGVPFFTPGQFKGCESKAAILVGFDSREENKWLNRHYFMSLSRVRECVVELITD